MKVLGIETSCDETGIAIYDSNNGIISSALYSQIECHKKFGGVVPEIASRSHLEKISSILKDCILESGIELDNLDAISVTNNPGLPGSLLVGVAYAKGLAWALNKPLIGVNHLDGHIYSACIENKVEFPFLCLTASGGHTSLYYVKSFYDYELIGETLDDAAGEAFDKVAKLIDLGYPGGPIIEKLAQQCDFQDYYKYPRAMHNSLNFSFSGVKTAVLYDLVAKNAYSLAEKRFLVSSADGDNDLKIKVSSSLLNCIADIFVNKIEYASRFYEFSSVCFVGGVACNKFIRSKLADLCALKNKKLFWPLPKYCTDNGAMIAFVGYQKLINGNIDNLKLDIL